MNAALNLARAYALVMGAAFLFGQAFTGHFSIAATLAGVSGVLATDAIHYYRDLDIPGSYYAWFLVAPFVVALVFIGYSSVRRR